MSSARIALVLLAVLAVAGCESFGRGVTQAVLDRTGETAEDSRACEIEGRPFAGIEPYLRAQDALPPSVPGDNERPELKVLYVHGIGTHTPGHATALRQNLARALGLEIRAPRAKRIVISHPRFPDQALGEINVSRLTDAGRRRNLLLYELTWSPITQPEKDRLAFDKDQELVLRRASVNQAMRTFVNDIAPDPLAYAGEKRAPILTAVTQSICWMGSRGWSELPELTEGTSCGPQLSGFGSRLDRDDWAIVTHSLGSRVTLDALQGTADLPIQTDPGLNAFADALAKREIQVFMLSNQLPLLEAGRERQEVVGQIAAYCGPNPSRPGRFLTKTRIVAFSDPNDLLSYPVPEHFAERYIDSRLCPSVTNITINVASVTSVLGLGEVANPLSAHSGYGTDERVGALLARGAGNPNVAPIVAERCTWRETDESLMQ